MGDETVVRVRRGGTAMSAIEEMRRLIGEAELLQAHLGGLRDQAAKAVLAVGALYAAVERLDERIAEVRARMQEELG